MKNRDERIKEWVDFIKNNPDWKKHHTEFINAQFQKSEDFYKKIAKQPGGKAKIIKKFGIKNIKAYPSYIQDVP